MYTIHIFPWNDGVHVKKYSTKIYNIFAWFIDKDDDDEDESSESEGEDGKDLEGIFDDVPLDNSDIQQVADDTQFSPISDTPPTSTNTITVDVEVHTPVVSLNIFCLDVKLFATEHAIFQLKNYNILLGLQRTKRCFNMPCQILKLPTTSESSSTETEDIPQENAHTTKSTITILSDMDMDALSLAQEEAEPPPPPPFTTSTTMITITTATTRKARKETTIDWTDD